MKCQINKKNNSQCDKDSIINENDLNMCKQHYKAFIKTNSINMEQQKIQNNVLII